VPQVKACANHSWRSSGRVVVHPEVGPPLRRSLPTSRAALNRRGAGACMQDRGCETAFLESSQSTEPHSISGGLEDRSRETPLAESCRGHPGRKVGDPPMCTAPLLQISDPADQSWYVPLHQVGGKPAEATSPGARGASCICVSRRSSTGIGAIAASRAATATADRFRSLRARREARAR
jgi:hypothetical protein